MQKVVKSAGGWLFGQPSWHGNEVLGWEMHLKDGRIASL